MSCHSLFFSCHDLCLQAVPRKKVSADQRSSKAQAGKGSRTSAKGGQSSRNTQQQLERDANAGESDVAQGSKPVDSVGKANAPPSQKRKQQQQPQQKQQQQQQKQQQQQQKQPPSPLPSPVANPPQQQNPKQANPQRHKQKSHHPSANTAAVAIVESPPQVVRIMKRASSASNTDTAPVQSSSNSAPVVSSLPVLDSVASSSKVPTVFFNPR
jgi:transcription initiation factor TFIID subunit TAF12